jgi:hypothetical protein
MQSIFRLAARLQKWPTSARNCPSRAGDLKMLCITSSSGMETPIFCARAWKLSSKPLL